MASTPDNISMAVFCDFENVALGVRDANYEKFDIKPVLERLLLKGSIVVKKAYCDWERYKGFKATMHEANFELIEIPHVRQSGKNSADIRLVVDALDLCYTKSHVNTFVIISGDSDFSPLVSKLRENNKQVIGVGVKQSTSDLLVANCDEFIFYDDLVREVKRAAAKRDERKSQPASPSSSSGRRAPDEKNDKRKEELEARKAQAIDMVVEMFDALVSERGDSGKIWASLLKDTLKRRRPEFNETYFGFRTFGNLLEEAQARGMLEFGRDEKSGAYVYRSAGQAVRAAETAVDTEHDGEREDTAADATHSSESAAISPEMASLLNPAGADAVTDDATDDASAPAAEQAPRRGARPGPARPPRDRADADRGRGRGRGRTDFRAPVTPQPDVMEQAAEALPATAMGEEDDAQPRLDVPASAPLADADARSDVHDSNSNSDSDSDSAEGYDGDDDSDDVNGNVDTAPAQQRGEWNEDSPFPPPSAAEKRRAPRAAAKKPAQKSANQPARKSANQPAAKKARAPASRERNRPAAAVQDTAAAVATPAPVVAQEVAVPAAAHDVTANNGDNAGATPARKSPARSRRPAKAKASAE